MKNNGINDLRLLEGFSSKGMATASMTSGFLKIF